MSTGRRPGTKIRVLKGASPDDPVRTRRFRLYDSEFARLTRLGDGNATQGLLKLLQIAEELAR